jgi:hypothetical protein
MWLSYKKNAARDFFRGAAYPLVELTHHHSEAADLLKHICFNDDTCMYQKFKTMVKEIRNFFSHNYYTSSLITKTEARIRLNHMGKDSNANLRKRELELSHEPRAYDPNHPESGTWCIRMRCNVFPANEEELEGYGENKCFFDDVITPQDLCRFADACVNYSIALNRGCEDKCPAEGTTSRNKGDVP